MAIFHNSRLMILAAGICILSTLAAPAVAQQKQSKDDSAKATTADAAIGEPTAEHKRLAALEGTWDQEIKIWLAPGKDPMVLKGTAQNKMILGGRFLQTQSEFSGSGLQAEALLIMGYDRRFSQYTLVDFDSAGTFYVTAAGSFDTARNAFVLSGEETQAAGAPGSKYDNIITLLSPDKYRTEIIFKKMAGAEGFKAVEITCTRAR